MMRAAITCPSVVHRIASLAWARRCVPYEPFSRMKVTVNKAAVKAMLFLTVPAASVLGFAHLLVPEMLWTFLGAKQHYVPQHYLYGDAFMGSTFLAFATAALIGLASDEPAGAMQVRRVADPAQLCLPRSHPPTSSILADPDCADDVQAVRALLQTPIACRRAGGQFSLLDARRYWVAALLASRASLSMANSFFLCGWLAFIAGDVYAFASGHRHEVVHKKST